MDIAEPRFAEEFTQFRWVVRDLERRLASVILQVRPAGPGALGQARGGAQPGHALQRRPCCCCCCCCRALTTAPPWRPCSSCWRASRGCWTATPSRPIWSASRHSWCAAARHRRCLDGAPAGLVLPPPAAGLPATPGWPRPPQVREYAHELREVAEAFNSARAAPPLGRNAAPYSGAVAWVRGLRERIAGGGGASARPGQLTHAPAPPPRQHPWGSRQRAVLRGRPLRRCPPPLQARWRSCAACPPPCSTLRTGATCCACTPACSPPCRSTRPPSCASGAPWPRTCRSTCCASLC